MKHEIRYNPNLIPALIAVLAVVLAMGLFIKYLGIKPPPPLGSDRASERRQALDELRTESRKQLESYAILNGANKTVRIPIGRAKQIIVAEWEHPAAGRAKLLARAEKAFFVPEPPAAPVAAEAASEYE